jgi:hypothetical protein
MSATTAVLKVHLCKIFEEVKMKGLPVKEII